MIEMIECKKKCEDPTNLTKKNYFDAGLDIKSNENCIIEAHDSKLISTFLIVMPFSYILHSLLV
jgi:hypothetical protein